MARVKTGSNRHYYNIAMGFPSERHPVAGVALLANK
jgi:hypothetical protein